MAEAPCDSRARDRMVLDPALGDVVKEQRDIEQRAVLGQDFPHQVMCNHELLVAAALDVASTPMQRNRCSSTV